MAKATKPLCLLLIRLIKDAIHCDALGKKRTKLQIMYLNGNNEQLFSADCTYIGLDDATVLRIV